MNADDILVQVLVTKTEYAVTITDRDNNPLKDHPATYLVMESGDGKMAISIDLTGELFTDKQAEVETVETLEDTV